MHIINNVALITINETLLLQVISFLIFLFLMNRIMFRPLRRGIDEREAHIEKIRENISAAQNKFESLCVQIRKQEKAVKNEAFEQKEKLEESASSQAAEILVSAHKEVSALKDQAQKEIDVQIAAARKHIPKESEELATKIIETVLLRSLNA
jgi:F-type H+-transporting ATPase subunit b